MAKRAKRAERVEKAAAPAVVVQSPTAGSSARRSRPNLAAGVVVAVVAMVAVAIEVHRQTMFAASPSPAVTTPATMLGAPPIPVPEASTTTPAPVVARTTKKPHRTTPAPTATTRAPRSTPSPAPPRTTVALRQPRTTRGPYHAEPASPRGAQHGPHGTTSESLYFDVYRLRHSRKKGDGSLKRALERLHTLPAYKSYGKLKAPVHRYSASILFAGGKAMSSNRRSSLPHGKSVEVIDAPSLVLPTEQRKGWAAYNPSIVSVPWGSRTALLAVFRVSDFNLCSWNGRAKLPIAPRQKTLTSRVVATIFLANFEVAVPQHDIEGLEPQRYKCREKTGMVRMGFGDPRVFLLRGQPWLLTAVMEAQGPPEACSYRMMFCPLALPERADPAGRVRCKRKQPLRDVWGEQIARQTRGQGRRTSVHQKNWAPFADAGQLYAISTLHPLRVLHCSDTNGDCTKVDSVSSPVLRGLRKRGETRLTSGVHGGSTSFALPAPHKGKFLGVGRIAHGRTQYVPFFFVFSRNKRGKYAITHVSPLFCIASTSPAHRGLCETIQSIGGVIHEHRAMRSTEPTVVLSYGANDCEAKVALVPLARIYELLKLSHTGRELKKR
eukprot:NODE_2608_length_2182_cov_2.680292.p1 GENE.NODE_2608_length_2182_cov_2.680292~~NODE_2608_length_2182_cov_2.680292.p1  ORF type:complete len:672 (-),score=118.47 NODE_2608_length_2182_cov_2.680292:166-1989(-)